MASKCKKSKIWPYRPWKMTFRAIQPNLSFDMWFMSPQRSSMPKKEEKLLKRFWDRPLPPPPLNLDGRTDRQTDGRTDRRTTDKSALEKLRCLSASGAKKSKIWPYRPWKKTFRAIPPDLSFDMWFMSPQRSSMPKKKKSYWSVSEIDPSPPPQSWRTDGQTDRRTDRQTDDGQIGIRNQ